MSVCAIVEHAPYCPDVYKRQVIRHFFNVYLHFFSRDENLGIPVITLTGIWLFLLASAQSESFGGIDESAVASAVTAFLCCHICTFPAVAKVKMCIRDRVRGKNNDSEI